MFHKYRIMEDSTPEEQYGFGAVCAEKPRDLILTSSSAYPFY